MKSWRECMGAGHCLPRQLRVRAGVAVTAALAGHCRQHHCAVSASSIIRLVGGAS